MAEYRRLMDFSNALVGVTVDALMNMGLNIPLIQNEMANAFTKGKGRDFLRDSGLTIEGDNVETITNSFAEKIKEVGLCQRANVLEISDEKVVIDLGECILAPVTKKIRGDDVHKIPPCPMMAILYGEIEDKTGKRGKIEKALWKPEENTTIFTLNLEG